MVKLLSTCQWLMGLTALKLSAPVYFEVVQSTQAFQIFLYVEYIPIAILSAFNHHFPMYSDRVKICYYIEPVFSWYW